jgi:alkanesulfonate monooxygenase SsuD/methylene tetrahydromethanopterin reductase-like flavin-dependent oxidoreductase (luciferase family)
VPLRREVFVDSTTEDAVEAGREYLEEKYRRYVQWGQNEAMEESDELSLPFEELARDRFLLGTPAEVCESIERYERELNASHLVVRVHWPGMPFERSLECIERFGDEVIPNV